MLLLRAFGCNPVLCRKCREDAIAYYYPQQGNAPTKLRCMLLDEELDAAQVVTAHIYQLHWGPEFAVRRHLQQACELLSVCTVCGVWLFGGVLFSALVKCQQDPVEVWGFTPRTVQSVRECVFPCLTLLYLSLHSSATWALP